MSDIINDINLGTLTITETYDTGLTQSLPGATPYLSATGSSVTISFIELERVESLSSFTFSASGITETRTIETEYRLSIDGINFTEWFSLDEEFSNFPPWDPLTRMWLDIKFTRSGTKTDGDIRVLSYDITGKLLRDESGGPISVSPDGVAIFKPPFIFKVFKITDIEIITSAASADFSIDWRYSQDNSRTWSNWEPLTKANITTKRINPVRFFEIEYRITNLSQSDVRIQDINLIGDFQNVTLDSQKTNLFGVRECCQSFLLANSSNSSNAGVYDENGIFIANTSGYLEGQTCPDDNIFKPMTADEKSGLFNPYQQTVAVNLLNKLSNDTNEIFGHRTQYFVTDPDEKGIDYSLHEYGTFNIVCEGELKVSVDNNQFPDNQITMNQFDLMLFDSFEIHITKESFKQLFGAQRRPSKEDLVYFCDINRMFIVDHAQQLRNFNNYAVYYKVILKKYNKSANVMAGDKTIEDRVNELTKNSTIDELFGIENDEDKKAVANKDQQQPLTKDPIRVEFASSIGLNDIIVKELIENSTTVISKQHYDFALALNQGAQLNVTKIVNYTNIDRLFKVSDNMSYFIWFNINNYIPGENFNLFNYHDDVNQLGWRVDLNSDVITVRFNQTVYQWQLDDTLSEDVWYCYLVNVDQRQRVMDQYIYKRDVDDIDEEDAKYLRSTKLREVYSNSSEITPFEYEIENNMNASLVLSDMKATNIRLFNDVIPVSQHTKLLNQYLIADDAKYLVFADNASMRVQLPNFALGTTSFE